MSQIETATKIIPEKSKVKERKKFWRFIGECLAVIGTLGFFGIPFYFVIVNALKNTQEASLLNMD